MRGLQEAPRHKPDRIQGKFGAAERGADSQLEAVGFSPEIDGAGDDWIRYERTRDQSSRERDQAAQGGGHKKGKGLSGRCCPQPRALGSA